MKVNYYLIFLCFWVFTSAFGQDSTAIVFDRPGIADSPYIVDLRNWQIEGGAFYVKEGKIEDLWYSSIMLRKSIHKRFELRFTLMHQPTSYLLEEYYDKADERYPISLFGKWKIVDEKGWIPDIALIGGLVVPIQRGFKAEKMGYELYAMLQNNIKPSFSINYGGGIIREHPEIGIIYSYSVCFNISLSSKVGLFFENYAYAKDFNRNWEEGIDAGIVFSPIPRNQIDLSAGYHFLFTDNWFFVSVGYSHAIFTKDKRKRQTTMLY